MDRSVTERQNRARYRQANSKSPSQPPAAAAAHVGFLPRNVDVLKLSPTELLRVCLLAVVFCCVVVEIQLSAVLDYRL